LVGRDRQDLGLIAGLIRDDDQRSHSVRIEIELDPPHLIEPNDECDPVAGRSFG
jgi:hypothetical protein